MEDLRHSPQNTKDQKDTHKWWQVSNCLKDRYEAETTHAKPENGITLFLREQTYIGFRQVLLFVEFSLELILKDKSRHQHRNKRRNKYLSKHPLRGNHPFNP